MSVQTTYSSVLTAAKPGQIADLNPVEIETRLCETAAGIGFGKVVSRGTDDDEAVLGGTSPIGVALRVYSNEDGTAYEQYETMAIIRKGMVWVTVSETGSPGDALNSVDATGVIGVGAAGAGETDLTGWTLEDSVGVGGGIARVRINA